MRAADLESLVAQRMYTSSLQVPATHVQTWRESRRDLADNYAELVETLQRVRVANRTGDADCIETLINDELGSDQSGSEASQSEASDMSSSDQEATDQEPPPAPSHRCARCGDTRNLELMLPTGPVVDAPMEAPLFCQECLHGS